MKKEEAIKYLLKFAEDNKYKSDWSGFVSGLIKDALGEPCDIITEEE